MEVRVGRPDWWAPPEKWRADLDQQSHLWLIDPDSFSSTQLADASEGLLSTDEARRWKRYRRDEDQLLFLAAHAFMRNVLSRYADVEPGAWAFTTNEHGRPEIDAAQQSTLGAGPVLRFNLSHTRGMVAVLVHDDVDAGVDVERLGAVEDPVAMAPTVFADQELEALDDAQPADIEASFYRLWTLKESFIKAKGMGLAIPLKDFWFSIDDPASIRLGCRPNVDPSPEAWDFVVVQPDAAHFVAVASATSRQTLTVIRPPAALFSP